MEGDMDSQSQLMAAELKGSDQVTGKPVESEAGVTAASPANTKAERLLALADGYRRQGKVWQAMELYWELVEQFPATGQSETAREALMALAQTYEREGQHHLARSLYERLL
jgi:TolA-binding protein